MAIEDRAIRLIEFIENEMPVEPREPRMRSRLLIGALGKKRAGFDRIPSFNALSAATSRRTASELAAYMTLGIDTNAIEDVKNDNLSIKGREDVRIFHIPNWNSDSVAEVKPDKAKELNSKHTVGS